MCQIDSIAPVLYLMISGLFDLRQEQLKQINKRGVMMWRHSRQVGELLILLHKLLEANGGVLDQGVNNFLFELLGRPYHFALFVIFTFGFIEEYK